MQAVAKTIFAILLVVGFSPYIISLVQLLSRGEDGTPRFLIAPMSVETVIVQIFCFAGAVFIAAKYRKPLMALVASPILISPVFGHGSSMVTYDEMTHDQEKLYTSVQKLDARVSEQQELLGQLSPQLTDCTYRYEGAALWYTDQYWIGFSDTRERTCEAPRVMTGVKVDGSRYGEVAIRFRCCRIEMTSSGMADEVLSEE